eukprot:jgi/Botrbrau1/21079/Bobra.0144s0077.1
MEITLNGTLWQCNCRSGSAARSRRRPTAPWGRRRHGHLPDLGILQTPNYASIVRYRWGESLKAATESEASVGRIDGSTEGSTSVIPLQDASLEVNRHFESWRWEDSADAFAAYTALFVVLGLGAIPALQGIRLADLPYFILLAALSIYIGAHRGLTMKIRQQISMREGLLAPIFASVSLFAVYQLLQNMSESTLLTFFDAYFWLIGSVAVVGAVALPLRKLGDAVGQRRVTVPVPEGLLTDTTTGQAMKSAELAPSDVLAALLGLAAASGDLVAHHSNFTLNNLLACAIVTDLLQLLGLRSFRTAGVLLVGLLLYDVFWVFASPAAVGDNVMLAVATSEVFQGPTRLLFPRFPGSVGEAASFPFSLLGLGDIAVPGLLACLALRYDASRVTDMNARATAAGDALAQAVASASGSGATDAEVARSAADAAEAAFDRVADGEARARAASQGQPASPHDPTEEGRPAPASFPVSEAVLQQRTYFLPVMVGYVAGLGMAFIANMVTHMGQPALLYLVPCTLSAVAFTASSRGELNRILNFQDHSRSLPSSSSLEPPQAPNDR